MTAPAANPEVLRALGHLVRGLSALFWGLPLALVTGLQTGRTDWLRPFGVLPPLIVSAILWYGLRLMAHFQPHERAWMKMLDRAQLLAVINMGLSPFLFWWYQAPHTPFFVMGVGVLALSGFLFLYDVNLVIRQLTAMLPDVTLRQETEVFTTVNMGLTLVAVSFFSTGFAIINFDISPALAARIGFVFSWIFQWLMVFLVLLPMAMTMAMIWKTKEFILASVFGGEPSEPRDTL